MDNKNVIYKKRDYILAWTSDERLQRKNSCYEIMLHKLCNEKCFFCSQDHKTRTKDPKPTDAQILESIVKWKKEGYWMLWFTWWEPLIHPKILYYVKFAKSIWWDFIRIQTNGVMLYNNKFAKDLVNAWVTLFKLSIHHYKSQIHDRLVRLPGAFDRVLQWIENLKKLNVRIWINIVLTKQNYKDLVEFVLFFLEKGITNFVIIFPLYEFSMKEEANRVWFKFTEAIPYVLKVVHIFDKLGLKRPLVLNLPMCLVPGYENIIIQTFNWTAVIWLDWNKDNIDDNKAFGKIRVPICRACKYNNICFWVDKEYINFWWNDEFKIDKKYNWEVDISDIKLKQYFSDDELCIFEMFKIKDDLTIDDIMILKDKIQICKDCNSVNKILSTINMLIKKWYVDQVLIDWKIVFKKSKKINYVRK